MFENLSKLEKVMVSIILVLALFILGYSVFRFLSSSKMGGVFNQTSTINPNEKKVVESTYNSSVVSASPLVSDVSPYSNGQWFLGDPHVHGYGCGGSKNMQQLLEPLQKGKINAASILIWGESENFDKSAFSPTPASYLNGNLVSKYDLEFSEFTPDPMGHLIALGLTDINFPKRMYRLPTAQWAKAQGATLGFAHADLLAGNYQLPRVSTNVPLEIPVDAALGYVDFISAELGPSEGFMQMYTSLENSGFRVGVAGASDYPCVTKPGWSDTYFYSNEGLSYNSWIKALKNEKTIMTMGTDLLTFSINGAILGDQLNLSGSQSLTLNIESNLEVGANAKVLVNGQNVGSVNLPAGKSSTTTTINIQKSSWIVLKSERTLTSPIYVIVNNKPIREKKDIKYLIDYSDWLTTIVQSKALVQDKPYPEHPDMPLVPAGINLASERIAIVGDINNAKAIYQQRLKEAD